MSEEFIINYYYMGQGDCILIVCPNGQLVMIDCGSAKGLGANNEDLMLKVYTDVRKFTARNKGKIDILILTHRDKDHYNQVKEIFSERIFNEDGQPPKTVGAVNIDTVYYSSPPTTDVAKFALYGFTQNSCSDLITRKKYQTTSIKQVFINATEKRMMTYTGADNFSLAGGVETQIEKRHVLIDGVTPEKRQWSVSLIAGQVPESNSDATDKTNALSLVTLLQIETAKGLFLGDATKATEDFLMKSQKSLIKDVDFVHIPHHGSLTSSGQTFVKTVNPKGAEVTHETYETGFKLPKGTVVERWLKALGQKGDADNHMIDYWEEIKETTFNKTLKRWQKDPIKYSVIQKDSGYYLLEIPKKYINDYIYIYRKNNHYWGLFRKQTDQNLWGTGATGEVQWTLPL